MLATQEDLRWGISRDDGSDAAHHTALRRQRRWITTLHHAEIVKTTMLTQDLRFAVRSFLRAPRFTVPAVVALALGIGATSAILSVVRGVILEPLPYKDPDRIVAIWERRIDRDQSRNVIAAANFAAWRERATSFELLGMVQPSTQNIVLNGQPEEIAGYRASSDALKAFGTEPDLGRIYTPEEDLPGSDQVMIVGHNFWQTRLGGR